MFLYKKVVVLNTLCPTSHKFLKYSCGMIPYWDLPVAFLPIFIPCMFHLFLSYDNSFTSDNYYPMKELIHQLCKWWYLSRKGLVIVN